MKNLIAAFALCLALAAPSRASTYSVSTDASSTTLKLNGRLHMQSLAGVEQLVIDSVRGLFTWTYGIQASTANFTATGNGTYAVTMSTGGIVNAGGWTAPWFSASTGFMGNLFGSLAGGTTGSLHYQSAPSVTSMLAATVNGYALQLSGGLPSWVAAVSSATNVAGGALGSILYQSAANTSAWLAAGSAGQILQANGAAAPSWTSGLSNSVLISTGNFSGLNGAGQLVQLNGSTQYPALDGSLITNLTGVISGLTAGKTVRASGATTIANGSMYDDGAGNITIVAPSTFTATGNVGFSSGVVIGTPDALITNNVGYSQYALSVDGAVESSGCVVVLGYTGSNATSKLTFTSTTTASVASRLGVLMETCQPNTVCRVLVSGIVLSNPTSSCGASCCGQTSVTRCRADANAVAINTTVSIRWIGAANAGTYSPMSIGF